MTHQQRLIEFLFQLSYDPRCRKGGGKAVRNVDELLVRVKETAQEWLDTEWKSEEIKDVCRRTITNIGTQKLREYAEKVFNECVREQGIKFEVSRGKPPSDKQLAMLRSLGSREIPQTASAASAIIGQLIARKKAA